MKRCILIFLLLISAFSYSRELSRPLLITTQNWKPYNYEDDEGNIQGIATEILTKTLNDMNADYLIRVLPWVRAQHLVKIGKADSFYVASINEERNFYAVPSDPLLPQIWHWYLLNSSKLSPVDENFRNKAKVASLLGTNMLRYIKNNEYNIEAQSTNMDSLVSMLLKQRVDAIFMNEFAMKEYLNNKNIPESRFKKFSYKSKPLRVYFSKVFLKENPWFLDEFNETLKKYKVE